MTPLRGSAVRLATLAILCGACNKLPADPMVESIEPSSGSNQSVTPVKIAGDSFYAAARANFDDPQQAGADTGFVVLLGDRQLESVTYHGRSLLKAVVPAGLPPQTYDLVVVDPWGRKGVLAQAFTVLGPGVTDGGVDGHADGTVSADAGIDAPLDSIVADLPAADQAPIPDGPQPPDLAPLDGPSTTDGGTWKPVASATGENLRDIWGTSASDIWAVGNGGAVVHYNGTAWSPVASPATGTNLLGVWSGSTTDAWAVGNGATAIHYDGSSWSGVSTGAGSNLTAVWGVSASAVWAVGSSGCTMVHYNGSAWSTVALGCGDPLYGIRGTSSSDVWAVGNGGTILHFNGSTWSSVTSGVGNGLTGVWPASSTSAWAVGNGVILEYDGASWKLVHASATYLVDVWGSSASDIWAVGNGGAMLHFDGTTWAPVSLGVNNNLTGVWGSSAKDVWVVGSAGLMLHYSP